jgi:4-hydroxy-tetrahydrodipicolinate synthase
MTAPVRAHDPLLRCREGLVVPIMTPLTEDGRLDVGSLARLRGRLIDAGAAGIFGLGSSGEASYLSEADRARVRSALGQLSAEDGVPLFVGVLEPTADRVIEAAQSLPAATTAVVVTGPFYARASATEIRRHFELVADAVRVPVLAYNIPSNVGYDLPGEVVSDLVRRGVIAGLKDSSPDVAALAALIKETDVPEALWLSGADAGLDAALVAGATGIVAGLSNVAPAAFVAELRAARAGDLEGVAEHQHVIDGLTDLYQPDPTGERGPNASSLGAMKTALRLLGVIDTDVLSAPMLRSAPARVAEVAAVLKRAGLSPVAVERG